MRKLKLYLDTSVISHLFADDTPDKMADTNLLWQDFIDDKYEAYISQVVIDEIEKCPEPKQGMMLEKLRQVNFQFLPETDEVITLADEYVNGGVLNQKNIADCRHIAHAVVNHCDVIVSWNFAHLANFKTISKVKVVNAMFHYREINIMPPTMFLEKEDEQE